MHRDIINKIHIFCDGNTQSLELQAQTKRRIKKPNDSKIALLILAEILEHFNKEHVL